LAPSVVDDEVDGAKAVERHVAQSLDGSHVPAIEQHLLAMLWSVNRAANVSVSRSSPMTPTGHLR